MGGVERIQSLGTREARAEALRCLYLDLLEKCILNTIYEDPSLKRKHGSTFDLDRRIRGADTPSKAHTMIGQLRLRNLHECVEHVLVEGIPGDLIETGVWRGGACIYMRAC